MLIAALVPPERAEAAPRLFGLYAGLELDLQNVGVIHDIDTWLAPTGKRTTIGGFFSTLDQMLGDVPPQLYTIWDGGYVPFVVLMTQRSTAEIASGSSDAHIRNWAHHFAVWAKSGSRRAFLAPLAEANGYWAAYYGPPTLFKQAFQRIRNIFEEELASEGASLRSVSWVFAANGWSLPGDEFEHYYPGSHLVDIVSINGFNYGGCIQPPAWDPFDVALRPYLDRLAVMAPTKPIFISETGTVDVPAAGVGDKNQWLHELVMRLVTYPRFRGFVYFNRVGNLPACQFVADYRLHHPGTSAWTGFWNAMAALPNYDENWATNTYATWTNDSSQMADIVFGREPVQAFADVPTIHPFALEPWQISFSSWIYALYAAGVTGGCQTNPLMYCPTAGVTRGEMAVFILRALFGADFVPSPATGTFADVPVGHLFAAWIEALAAIGITTGCGGGNYCPDLPVTRGQMAIFLLRARRGALYVPPPGTGTLFADVPSSHMFGDWIEGFASEGITSGCGGGNYCPDAAVTRAQMAVFLVRTFDIPL